MNPIFRSIGVFILAGCSVSIGQPPLSSDLDIAATVSQSQVSFDLVVQRIEPLAEQMCRQRSRAQNCDFRIFIDGRANQPPNAYQRLDGQGRPEIGFTTALIAQFRNNDELAFVLGHEMAHHLAGHISKSRDTALAGAVLAGLLATLVGGGASDIDLAQNIGGSVGARAYSKNFELEADQLGTIIAFQAGFDPLAGAQFFTRIPDPGDRFLGTHPANAARIAMVRRSMAGLR